MKLEDYKTILYRQEDGSWVAEIPAIAGCYALMQTREKALAELENVFEMIAAEYREKGQPLPAQIWSSRVFDFITARRPGSSGSAPRTGSRPRRRIARSRP